MSTRWQHADPLAGLELMLTPTWDPAISFRFRNDDGNQLAATWKAAQNTTITQVTEQNFRLRTEVQMTNAGDPDTIACTLQYQVDGGAWTTVTAATSVRLASSAFIFDGASTTDQLTAGTGTFSAGKTVTATNPTSIFLANASGHSELEWCLQLVGLTTNQVVGFRVLIDGVAHVATTTPTLTALAYNPAVAPTLLTPADLSTADGTEFTWQFNSNNAGATQQRFAFRIMRQLAYPSSAETDPVDFYAATTSPMRFNSGSSAISPDGAWLAHGASNNAGTSSGPWYYIWNRSTGALIAAPVALATSTSQAVNALGFSGVYFVFACYVGSTIEGVASQFLVALDSSSSFTVAGSGGLVTGTGFHANLAVSPTAAKGVVARDTTAGFTRFDLPNFDNRVDMTLPGPVSGFAYSADGSKLYVAHRHALSSASNLRVYDTTAWTHTVIPFGGSSSVFVFNLSFANNYLAFTSFNLANKTYVLDVTDPASPTSITLPAAYATLDARPTWDPAGRVLYWATQVTSGGARELRIMEPDTWTDVWTGPGYDTRPGTQAGSLIANPYDNDKPVLARSTTKLDQMSVTDMATQWWNGAAFVGTETFIESSAQSLILPAGAFE